MDQLQAEFERGYQVGYAEGYEQARADIADGVILASDEDYLDQDTDDMEWDIEEWDDE